MKKKIISAVLAMAMIIPTTFSVQASTGYTLVQDLSWNNITKLDDGTIFMQNDDNAVFASIVGGKFTIINQYKLDDNWKSVASKGGYNLYVDGFKFNQPWTKLNVTGKFIVATGADNKNYLLKQNGDKVVDTEYDTIINNGNFSLVGNKGSYGVIENKSGTFVYNVGIIKDYKEESEGLRAIQIEGKWGYVDDSYNQKVDFLYSSTLPFKNGYASVSLDNYIGLIDTSGNKVSIPNDATTAATKYKWFVSPKTYAFDFGDTYLIDYNYQNGSSQKQYGIINTKTNYKLYDYRFMSITPFNHAPKAVGIKYLDKTTRELDILNTNGDIVKTKINPLYGIQITKNDNLIYTDIAGTQVTTGMFDSNMKEIIKPGTYQKIDINDNGTLTAYSGGYETLEKPPYGIKGGVVYNLDLNGNVLSQQTNMGNTSIFETAGTNYMPETTGVLDKYNAYSQLNDGYFQVTSGKKSGVVEIDGYYDNSGWSTAEIANAIKLNLVSKDFTTKAKLSYGKIADVNDNLQSFYKYNITREEFCDVAVHFLQAVYNKNIDAILAQKGIDFNSTAFIDTNNHNVLAAKALGIVSGDGKGHFSPYKNITRQEAAVMLYNVAKLVNAPLGNSITNFNDKASFANWSKDSILYISALKDKTNGNIVLGGIGNNTFSPLGLYTREQAYASFVRLFNSK